MRISAPGHRMPENQKETNAITPTNKVPVFCIIKCCEHVNDSRVIEEKLHE